MPQVMKVHAVIMGSLSEYENQKIEEWGRDVEASSQVHNTSTVDHIKEREHRHIHTQREHTKMQTIGYTHPEPPHTERDTSPRCIGQSLHSPPNLPPPPFPVC
jgi:hypothetical protein